MTISARQVGICQLSEAESDLGNSPFFWSNHYQYLWDNRTGAKESQEMYVNILNSYFVKIAGKNDSFCPSSQFIRLAYLNHPFFKSINKIAQGKMVEPFMSEIIQLELEYNSAIQKLDFLVDEGYATWQEKAAKDMVLKYKINPILPIEGLVDDHGHEASSFNSVNPYMRGYSLCLEIEKKLGSSYVPLACSIASLPIHLLSKYLELDPLIKIPKDSLWHPERRLKSIADVNEDQVARIRELLDKAMAFFELLDFELEPLPLFAIKNNSFMRNK